MGVGTQGLQGSDSTSSVAHRARLLLSNICGEQLECGSLVVGSLHETESLLIEIMVLCLYRIRAGVTCSVGLVSLGASAWPIADLAATLCLRHLFELLRHSLIHRKIRRLREVSEDQGRRARGIRLVTCGRAVLCL